MSTKSVEWEPAVSSLSPEQLARVLAEMDGYLATHTIRTGGCRLLDHSGGPLNIRFLTDLDLPDFCSVNAQGEFGFQVAMLRGFQSAELQGQTRVLSFGSRFALMTGEIAESDLQDAISRICAYYLPDLGVLPICGGLTWQKEERWSNLYLGRPELRRKLFRACGLAPANTSCGLGWSSSGILALDPRDRQFYPHPANVFFLIADEAGVIPPVSMLTNERAVHYFQHGSHEAEPPVAHLCFGGRGSFRSARDCSSILTQRLEALRPRCWMLNLGALGGPHGKPIDIGISVSLLRAALNGTLAKMSFQFDANFHLLVPVCCPGVPTELLDQRMNWLHPREYDAAARTAAASMGANHLS